MNAKRANLLRTSCTVFLLWAATAAAGQTQVTISEYRRSVDGGGEAIAAGPDGSLWFTDGSAIARITTGGVITDFPVTALTNIGPQAITMGPGGNLWYTDAIQSGVGKIGRITTTGVSQEFVLPAGSNPDSIAAGPDGDLWFTDYQSAVIGRVTPAGAVTEFPITYTAAGIVAGPDGNLWFAENRFIGRITVAGVVTEFALPNSGYGARGINTGPDGNLWFTVSESESASGSVIGKITTAGVIAEFPIPTPYSNPWGIAPGSDGNLWFTEASANKIGRVTPAGVVTEFPVPSGFSSPQGIAAGPDGNVWFVESTGVGRVNIAPVPVLSGLSPNSISAGTGSFTLTVSGSGFVNGSVVQWSGAPLSTAFASSSQLTASVPADLIASAGNTSVGVQNPDGAISNLLPFAINASAAAPIVTLSQTSLTFGNDAVGSASAQQIVTLTNTGTAPLNITNIGITGTNAADFSQNSNCGISIGAGVACTINVTFQPTAAGTRNAAVSITDNANNSPQTISLTGTGLAGALPSISPGGVVPIFSTASTIQPGEWVSIYGSNLASGITVWNGDFPTSLGGTSVKIDGKSAYLSLASPGQINLQAPDDATRGSVSVVVTTANGSATSTVSLGQFGPSFSLLDAKHVAGIILRSNGSGAYGGGTYDILGPTGTSLGYPTVAAKPGDSVELFAVGLGPTTPSVPPGQTFSGAASTNSAVTLLINNVSVTPSFAGLSSAGLYQINVTIPSGLGIIGDVPLQASVAGVQTQKGVVISLQNATVANPALTISTSGTGSGTVGASPTGTSCGAGCLSFAAGTVVTLTATPNTGSTFAGWSGACSGTGSCTVTMNSNQAVTAAFNLTVTSAITLSATSVSFGSQALQTVSPAQSILVTSNGTGPLTVNSIAVSGPNSADFLQFNNCPASAGVLTAKATCFINVMFKPSATMGESATLMISNNAPGSPQSVSLSGQGVGQQVTITPPTTTVEISHSVPFIQNVTGLSGTGVTWNATAGTISAAGLYTAPASVPNPATVTVTATSQSNPAFSASATVTIIPTTIGVLASPASASVQAGSSEMVTAAVVGASNTAVTWSVNGVANGSPSVGTIAISGGGANVATYTAPSTLPSSNPVTITATSIADPTKSDSASITIVSGAGISITSLDKTSLQPFNLLTISGAGFDPQAALTVNFSNNSGYSVNVPPVSVAANAVVVSVPPYISASSGDFATGSVNIQISQTLRASTVTSNAFSGFQIPNLPTLPTQPGAVTLALLTQQSQVARFLMNYFSQGDPTVTLNTPEMNGALNVLAFGLGPLMAEISDVVQNPTHTFTLGVASGSSLTVGSSELAKADRMIVGMLYAQAAAGYVDAPEPDCESVNSANLVELTFQAAISGSSNPTQFQQTYYGCATAQAPAQGLEIVGASAGVATGVGGLLFGAESTALTSAVVSSQLTYITTTLGLGMSAVGGALGQGSAYARALVQSGVKIVDDYLKDAVTSTIVSRTIGESAGNLFDLTVNANELVHAFEAAPPYGNGPSAGPTSTLTVVPTGTGAGTVESYPGGLVCGGPDSTVCVVPFSTGETVYLDSQPSPGSTPANLSAGCAGTGTCTVVMNGNQIVGATFNSAQQFTLTTATSGTGTGTVGINSSASSLNCGSNCLSFAAGSVVTLTAAPSTGSSFAGWSGACAGTGACTLTMDANKTVTATFNVASSGGDIDLTGTWTGAYSFSGGYCNWQASGQLVFVITKNAFDPTTGISNFSGTVSLTNYPAATYLPGGGCSFTQQALAGGDLFLPVSGGAIQGGYADFGPTTYDGPLFLLTGTISGSSISGGIQLSTGGGPPPGTFSVHR